MVVRGVGLSVVRVRRGEAVDGNKAAGEEEEEEERCDFFLSSLGGDAAVFPQSIPNADWLAVPSAEESVTSEGSTAHPIPPFSSVDCLREGV